MMKLVMILAATLMMNSPWVTYQETISMSYTVGDSAEEHHVKRVYTHKRNETRDMLELKEITEEVDENGVTWEVYHFGRAN